MENYTIILNEDAERFELWLGGKFIAAIWEWYAADEEEAEFMFDFFGYMQ